MNKDKRSFKIDFRGRCGVFLLGLFFLTGCVGNMSPTGNNTPPDYPYYITTKLIKVKNVEIPIGTRLTYEEHFFKEGKQNEMLNEKKLITIELQDEVTIDWGGVPITSIRKFFIQK